MNTNNINNDLFTIKSLHVFDNTQETNSIHIDTFENHFIDFSSSRNVSLDTSDYTITLLDSSLSGYFVSQPIISSQNSLSTLNDFILFADSLEPLNSSISFTLIVNRNEEYEINHRNSNILKILNGANVVQIKCVMRPYNNVSPLIKGYSLMFVDDGVKNINTTTAGDTI